MVILFAKIRSRRESRFGRGWVGTGIRTYSVLLCEASTGHPNGDVQKVAGYEDPEFNRYFNNRQRFGC